MSSLRDFFQVVSSATWEAELGAKILEGAVAVAKVLGARSGSFSQVEATSSTPSAASAADDPLLDSVRQMLEQNWKARCPEMCLKQ